MTQNRLTATITSLLQTMAALRQPDGCPWDAEQTPQSLIPYIIEEACELVDAIESGATELIKDELGDLLLQVVFQAQIFKEQGHFEFSDVAETIDLKLKRRHPHVFAEGEQSLRDPDLNRQWDKIKQSERTTNGRTSCLADHLPNQLPALQRAQKLASKLHKASLDHVLTTRLEPKPTQPEAYRSNDTLEQTLTRDLMNSVIRAEAAGIDAESLLRRFVREVAEGVDLKTGNVPATKD